MHEQVIREPFRFWQRLSWQEVIGQPVVRLLATYDGLKGARYEDFGIELGSGAILNMSHPSNPFRVDADTRVIVPPHDLLPRDTPSSFSAEGKRIQALIYHVDPPGSPRYFAVLNSGEYVTCYPSFNYTEFSFACWRDWRPGLHEATFWGRPDLTEHSFFNAWDHTQIDPFRVYR